MPLLSPMLPHRVRKPSGSSPLEDPTVVPYDGANQPRPFVLSVDCDELFCCLDAAICTHDAVRKAVVLNLPLVDCGVRVNGDIDILAQPEERIDQPIVRQCVRWNLSQCMRESSQISESALVATCAWPQPTVPVYVRLQLISRVAGESTDRLHRTPVPLKRQPSRMPDWCCDGYQDGSDSAKRLRPRSLLLQTKRAEMHQRASGHA